MPIVTLSDREENETVSKWSDLETQEELVEEAGLSTLWPQQALPPLLTSPGNFSQQQSELISLLVSPSNVHSPPLTSPPQMWPLRQKLPEVREPFPQQ